MAVVNRRRLLAALVAMSALAACGPDRVPSRQAHPSVDVTSGPPSVSARTVDPTADPRAGVGSPTEPQVSPAANPAAGLAARVFVVGAAPQGQTTTCDSGRGGPAANCPATDRLNTRIEHLDSPAASLAAFGGASLRDFRNPVCRCVTVTSASSTLDASGSVAHVVVQAPDGVHHIDLVIIPTAAGPLVDDIRCTGAGDTTSLYSEHPTTC